VASLEAFFGRVKLVITERVRHQAIVLGVYPLEHPVDHLCPFWVCGGSHHPSNRIKGSDALSLRRVASYLGLQFRPPSPSRRAIMAGGH
jgi:hypothetical protein